MELKKRNPRKKCPKCGSGDITLYMGTQLGVIYTCKACGYRGVLVVEEEDEAN